MQPGHGSCSPWCSCTVHDVTLAEPAGRRLAAAASPLTLPEWALIAIGRAEELRAAVTGHPPSVDPGMAHYLSKYQYVGSSKAIHDLGYVIPDFDDTVDWYRSQGRDL
jgi:hypothetical protein